MSLIRSTWLIVVLATSPVLAQDSRRSLDLTVGGVGISIGDSRRVNGLRINYRDSRLEKVNGINATIWTPYRDGHGDITGLSLGLPATGGRQVKGLLAAFFGAEISEDFGGISVAGLGMGVAQDATGIIIGGLGSGVGGSVRGAMIGGLGSGVGGDATGIFINGFGMGAGGTISFLTINGFGLGAPRIHGAAIAGAVIGAPEAKGLMLAGAWLRIREEEGDDDRSARFRRSGGALFQGVGVSAFNQIKGRQNGLTIGLLNYAWSLSGVQLGLLNIVRDNPPGRKVLPLLNWGSNR
jgi:hypothetical protein